MNRTRLVLVRHGETVWHAENRFAGSTDIELTERGMRQADALAEWASTADLTAIYSSPLRRAMATAGPSSRRLALPLTCEDRLRELHFGRGEGMTHAEMAVAFPQSYRDFLADPVDSPLPGGERPREAIVRANSALREIAAAAAERAPDPRVLVVMHNTLIRLLLCIWLGLDPARYRQIFPELGNVALTEVVFGPEGSAPEIGLLCLNAPLGSPAPDTNSKQA